MSNEYGFPYQKNKKVKFWLYNLDRNSNFKKLFAK